MRLFSWFLFDHRHMVVFSFSLYKRSCKVKIWISFFMLVWIWRQNRKIQANSSKNNTHRKQTANTIKWTVYVAWQVGKLTTRFCDYSEMILRMWMKNTHCPNDMRDGFMTEWISLSLPFSISHSRSLARSRCISGSLPEILVRLVWCCDCQAIATAHVLRTFFTKKKNWIFCQLLGCILQIEQIVSNLKWSKCPAKTFELIPWKLVQCYPSELRSLKYNTFKKWASGSYLFWR